MSDAVLYAAASWWAGGVPMLPSPEAMQWGLQASWSVVLAWLGAVLAARWTRKRAAVVGVALALAASAWLPGQGSSSYWLGLAFQAPSISTVLLCGVLMRAQWLRALAGSAGAPPGGAGHAVTPDGVLAVLGVLLGWALLLDTLALLPVQLYAWGFSPIAAVVAVWIASVPWLLFGRVVGMGVGTVVCALAVLVFVLLRLPSGNLWDAVLDPWLWLVLHVHVGRSLRRCY